MKTVRIALFASFAVYGVSAAWGQYGLYGSPDTLQFPQQPAPAYAATNPYQPATAAYPATATPTTATTYPSYSYSTSPQYHYPAQQPRTAWYQPYQPGAQYRYPAPYAQPQPQLRPPVRTAAVDSSSPMQPIPAPPASPVDTAMPVPNSAPGLQGPGMVNQMLTDPNSGCCGCDGVYRGAVGQYEQAACGYGCDASGCGGIYCCPWYASVSALALSRSDSCRVWTSYRTTDLTEQGGNTQFPMAWKWGGEIRFGRRFCCGCVPYALEASYWTTEAFTGSRLTQYPGDTVNTVLNIDYITFDVPGVGACPASLWFMGAGAQTLDRRDEFHNIEINLIREQLAWACDSPWDIGWSIGVRYFRFQESLVYGSVMPNHTRGSIYDAYLSDEITNNLLGVQFGFDAAYNICYGLRVFITPKVGLYNNYLDNNFQAQLGNHTTNGYSTPYGTYYPVHGSRNALSFLTQVDLGADWQFSRNWSARVGYRVLAATGIGLAEAQFPQYICDVPELQYVKNCNSLVLHGAFAGLTYNF